MSATLTTRSQQLLEVWQQHTYSEFVMRDATAALQTMSANPYVLMVPIAVGGQGREGVHNFYATKFLAQMPADFMPISVSQTIAENRIIKEAVYTFTHDLELDWMVPGVPATGKRLELAVIGVITFEDDKIASEHLYWDHAGVLAQLGVLDATKVPIVGVEGPRTLLAWSGKTPSP